VPPQWQQIQPTRVHNSLRKSIFPLQSLPCRESVPWQPKGIAPSIAWMPRRLMRSQARRRNRREVEPILQFPIALKHQILRRRYLQRILGISLPVHRADQREVPLPRENSRKIACVLCLSNLQRAGGITLPLFPRQARRKRNQEYEMPQTRNLSFHSLQKNRPKIDHAKTQGTSTLTPIP